MAFDYDNTDGPDIDTIRSVAAEMSGGQTKPPTDEERLQHEAWLFDCRQRERQQQEESELRRAETEAAKLAQERQTAALERAERNRQLQERSRQQSERQMQSRQLSDLHQASIEQQAFRRNVMRSQSHAAAREDLSKTLDDWMAMKYPPPPPEPTVVVVSEDDGSADLGSRNFDVAKWSKKPRSWWR